MADIDWPAELPQCVETWNEQALPVTVRTQFDTGRPKVRRRFTGTIRNVDVSMTMAWDKYERVRDFFDVDCRGGVDFFNFPHPYLLEAQEFRMREAPRISNQSALAITVQMNWEQLPAIEPEPLLGGFSAGFDGGFE